MSARHRSGGHRVAVTGIGVKCPAGNGIEEVFKALLTASPAAARVERLVEADLPVQIACLVPEFEVDAYLSRRESRQIDRPALLLVCAAADAVAEARLPADLRGDRVGVQIGTGIGGLTSMEEATVGYAHQPRLLPVHTVPRTMANSAASRLALRYGFQGACTTYASACASGATALGAAARKIRYGELDVAVAGGVDAAVSTVVVGSFARMRALSTRNEAPELASRPFDSERDGFVMGEGAAVLVLERWDLALARGAVIHGEIAGYAENCDAFHIVAPHEDGEVAGRCMREAVADAGLAFTDIAQVSAHGTSTVPGDQAEARAIERCFAGQSPPVTAVKGVTGHLIGAAGALEAAVGLLCAARGVVPPIANLRSSPEADRLDLVAGVARGVAPGPVLSNSFGFGGQNACLVLAPPP
ncbi:3-oxoacyl-ACP synthase [Kitasatospora sp. MMS16-BH015]|uniref:beta-ketoacyl-[acyl-carrier-protein] synthase family protein n=1 Tax=Kitasatospora sp. MMS16-BH015 TaxID=2018025 RepID=UPI000CA1B2F6|nr:beta-ketoacyl-[acyl-carrier-protein] synthase family protein [Kitasatospora sp. MMS16-BH015]AUG82133.1 3-oxoacyl-ACP synthase [Kitasatospora sp. MMS16-BH015]